MATTTLTNGTKIPERASRDWYSDLSTNWYLLDNHLGDTDSHLDEGLAPKATADADGNTITSTYATKTELSTLSDTVGTKANDSEVVHKTGAETIAGAKTFSDTLTSANVVPSATDTYSLGSASVQYNSIYGKVFYENGTAISLTYATKTEVSTLDNANVKNITASGDVLTITKGDGTTQTVTTQDTKTTQTVTQDAYIYPLLISQTSADIYAGVIPTTETATARKAYSVGIESARGFIYARNSSDADNLKGVAPSRERISAQLVATTYDNAIIGDVEIGRADRYGNRFSRLSAVNYITDGAISPTGSFTLNTLDVGVAPNGTPYLSSAGLWYNNLVPFYSKNYSLGTSALKWKTLNGVNPGALSLPAPAPSSDPIDTTNWDLTGATINYYTATEDGWISICVRRDHLTYVCVSIVSGSTWYAQQVMSTATINQVVAGMPNHHMVCLPVRAGQKVAVVAICTAFTFVSFYPCQGNV